MSKPTSMRKESVKGNEFCVYQLVDPRTHRPFYIGSGKGMRAWTHLQRDHTNAHTIETIADLRATGLEPIVKILRRNLTEFRLQGLITAHRALALLWSLKPREAVHDAAAHDECTEALVEIVFHESTECIHEC